MRSARSIAGSLGCAACVLAVLGVGAGSASANTPNLMMDDKTIRSSTNGIVDMPFAVWLDAAADHEVSVYYRTTADTAVPDLDYTSVSGVLTFPVGVVQQEFNVPILPDVQQEVTFFIDLSGAVGANLGVFRAVGTIQPVDSAALTSAMCGSFAGPANLAGFYAVCWLGLAGMKWGRRRRGDWKRCQEKVSGTFL